MPKNLLSMPCVKQITIQTIGLSKDEYNVNYYSILLTYCMQVQINIYS